MRLQNHPAFWQCPVQSKPLCSLEPHAQHKPYPTAPRSLSSSWQRVRNPTLTTGVLLMIFGWRTLTLVTVNLTIFRTLETQNCQAKQFSFLFISCHRILAFLKPFSSQSTQRKWKDWPDTQGSWLIGTQRTPAPQQVVCSLGLGTHGAQALWHWLVTHVPTHTTNSGTSRQIQGTWALRSYLD